MIESQEEHFFHKHRLEALSDAVFAIVMTLLVLDLKVPHDLDLYTAIHMQGSELPRQFFSFCMTFVISAVFWTLQHHVFEAVKDVGKASLGLTFVMLAFVSLLPFSTSLIGNHKSDHFGFEIYFANQFAIAVALTAKTEVAHFLGHLHENANAAALRFRLYRMSFVMLGAIVGVHFLSIEYASFVPAGVGLVFRILQRKWKLKV